MATRRPRAAAAVHHDRATSAPKSSEKRTSSALELWVKLSRAQNAIAAHAQADVARHGLTLAEFAILEALFHRGQMLLGEVQRRILVSSGGITFLADRLTAKGLVERRNCERDRRARYVALTPKGERLVAEIFPSHADVIEQATSGLSSLEQAQASALLRKLGLAAAARAAATKDAEPDE